MEHRDEETYLLFGLLADVSPITSICLEHSLFKVMLLLTKLEFFFLKYLYLWCSSFSVIFVYRLQFWMRGRLRGAISILLLSLSPTNSHRYVEFWCAYYSIAARSSSFWNFFYVTQHCSLLGRTRSPRAARPLFALNNAIHSRNLTFSLFCDVLPFFWQNLAHITPQGLHFILYTYLCKVFVLRILTFSYHQKLIFFL